MELWQKLSGQPREAIIHELESHLATRIFFMLLGEVSEVANYDALERRLAEALGSPSDEIGDLAKELARTLACTDHVTARKNLSEIPYPFRAKLRAKCGNRCSICGWDFASGPVPPRVEAHCVPHLDHRVPIRIGGDADANLWLLCGLCNSVKGSALIVGEHGRVWSNNFIYSHRLNHVALWTMLRDGACTESDCAIGPSKSRLCVVRRTGRGRWVLDNARTVCSQHAEGRDVLSY